MRTLLKLLLAFLVFVILLIVGLVWYIAPDEDLDLTYAEVPIQQKIVNMAKNLKLETAITEQEINDLAKKQLAAHPRIGQDIEVTGARFELNGDSLTAHLNLIYRGLIRTQAAAYFQLEWRKPSIVATLLRTEVKGYELPPAWVSLKPIAIPIEDKLPDFVGIRSVDFEPNGIVFRFKLLNPF